MTRKSSVPHSFHETKVRLPRLLHRRILLAVWRRWICHVLLLWEAGSSSPIRHHSRLVRWVPLLSRCHNHHHPWLLHWVGLRVWLRMHHHHAWLGRVKLLLRRRESCSWWSSRRRSLSSGQSIGLSLEFGELVERFCWLCSARMRWLFRFAGDHHVIKVNQPMKLFFILHSRFLFARRRS